MRGYADSDRSQPLTTYEVHGHKIQIFVRASGDFDAKVEGKSFSAPTLDSLRQKLRKATKAARVVVAIPATRVTFNIGRMNLHDVTLTGLNAKTDAILFKWDHNGRADQESQRFGQSNFYRRMSEAEKKRLVEAHEAWRKAEDAYNKLRRAVEIDAGDVLKEAIAEAVDKEPEVEEPAGDPRLDPQPKGRKKAGA